METGTETGYAHSDYAASLAEWGRPRCLPLSRGWILERTIPGRSDRDATGCYPLFSCLEWSQLAIDLDALRGQLVSITLVTDPFGDYEVEYLKDCFEDAVVPFKQHFVTDLSRSPESFVGAHHLRNVRKALRLLTVEECKNPSEFLGDWVALYNALIEKHGIKGLAAFSPKSFARQLEVPGIVVFRASHRGTTTGMLLWYVQGSVAYYHLGAYSEQGYQLHASFALFSRALEEFAQRGIRWLDLGAGPGLKSSASDGLSRFKRGWSTGTRPAYLCGRIFNHSRYAQIVQATGVAPTDYFPAYRKGEFG
ncbi:MAG: GNAT family N-acetyltransferase [Pyrinomonadaceae bacterium]